MRAVIATLAVALAAVALALALVLSRAPVTVAGTNSVRASAYGEVEHGPAAACQPVGTVPRGTSAIRLAIEARVVGPAVSVRVLSGGEVVSRGMQPAGWGSAPTVTVPIAPLVHAVVGARVCTTVGPSVEPFRPHGASVGAAGVPVGEGLGGVLLRMEYLRLGRRSWWSLLPSVATHLGMGRAASGAWIWLLVLALMLAVMALAVRLLVRELG